LNPEVEYRVFSQHCGSLTERFLNTASVTVGKSIGRVTAATPDVVENVNQIVQRNLHISVYHLSQQIGKSELKINLFLSPSKLIFFIC
jgi:hypothetical protein